MVENELVLRMVDGYGIAGNYRVKDACPYDGTKIKMKEPMAQVCDGEFTYVDQFTCQEYCLIQYRDMLLANGFKERDLMRRNNGN